MKRNGFTLIELLAVIIILAIVTLIATPIIINVVEDTKKEGFKQTALGYYKAAEYVYDEMMMNEKTENIQFTFEDGKQTSSNENYKLEVKGETPQGGLVYLTKEGHIAVSINNNKYCVYVDGNKEVTINEDINHCGYTPVPEGCYSIQQSTSTLISDSFDESGNKIAVSYNVLKYDISSSSTCPKKFNMLILPSEIDGQKIEGVRFATNRQMLKITAQDIIFPSETKIIGAYAFNNNGSTTISNIILPEGLLSIGNHAFMKNNLTSINIPNSVQYIGNAAFKNNQLANITVPSGVTTIEESVFENNQLTNVVIPSSIIAIENNAFKNNQLTNIVIPHNVEQIGDLAFANNQLTNISILSNGAIRPGIFNNNKLPDNQAFIYERNEDGTIDNTKLISYGGAKRENVVIPDNVETIAYHAFYSNNLKSVLIPNTVKEIHDEAFDNNDLTELTIPESLNIIWPTAFKNNKFPNASAITIEGDATRFDSQWTQIGFPAK